VSPLKEGSFYSVEEVYLHFRQKLYMASKEGGGKPDPKKMFSKIKWEEGVRFSYFMEVVGDECH
jgi:hypothetical protein